MELNMSDRKEPKKAKQESEPKTRVRVEKSAFDKVLKRLIKSKPEKRPS
jgi:hypothetical protein